MYSIALSAVALLASVLPTTLAQTHTDCNPLNSTKCPSMDALGSNATFNFKENWNPKIWVKKNQGDAKWTEKGTSLTVARSGDSPNIESKFYMFFGRMEVVMKAATGQGIVSSAILQSEDLDEIDWEFKGGKKNYVSINYFGKGNQTYDTARFRDIKKDWSPMDDYHNYTLDWTKERIQWWIDGEMQREVKYGDALGGKNYPQTPMNIRLGAWAAGDVSKNTNGTVDWAGGPTNFDEGPFTMMVESVYAKDYTTAKEYSWENMDESGSWEKVKVIAENTNEKSDTLKEIESPHGVKNRWAALSKTAKIAILASVAGAIVIIICIVAFCCIKQRRAGRREYAAYSAQESQAAADLVEHKQTWANTHRSSRYNRI